jgi:hypothetical protein
VQPLTAYGTLRAMTYRRLAAVALFALGTASFAAKPKVERDPCTSKGSEAQEKCSKECFKVEANKQDQKPTKGEMKCMAGCSEKAAKVTTKCYDEAQKKANAAGKKEHEETGGVDAL